MQVKFIAGSRAPINRRSSGNLPLNLSASLSLVPSVKWSQFIIICSAKHAIHVKMCASEHLQYMKLSRQVSEQLGKIRDDVETNPWRATVKAGVPMPGVNETQKIRL